MNGLCTMPGTGGECSRRDHASERIGVFPVMWHWVAVGICKVLNFMLFKMHEAFEGLVILHGTSHGKDVSGKVGTAWLTKLVFHCISLCESRSTKG